MSKILGLLILILMVGTLSFVLLVGLGLFLLRFAANIQDHRQNVSNAMEDITDMFRLFRSNFEELKNFIRSVV